MFPASLPGRLIPLSGEKRLRHNGVNVIAEFKRQNAGFPTLCIQSNSLGGGISIKYVAKETAMNIMSETSTDISDR